MADSPDIRVGTAERETAMRRLSDHFAAGRLSVAEFDERSAVIAAAVTRGDLVQVFTDLPEPVAAPQQPAPQTPPQQHRGGKQELRGAVMGLSVLAALVLFFVFHTWICFLLIPAAGILLGAFGQTGSHDPGRRGRRAARRDRRRGR
ncbi:DUF1707 SHOCT-like domain-containing protein [Nocardia macrotermitis]|uniref:DUF1707 domain-containing protein n=1 Tax=Nocardia macrotermitis TaxID=2585198 RepID=A0A7K0DC50_9NOCA|nr:DUF1707 domain-containing protein [Nocardia macrotermitis]MQY23365.1 hypothetical protein [Nocardia macrotermitis]